ncbi:hypothetical protein FN846DRAFT_186848 [Sphaerosporella brunnea]|uniref:Uncharacterized protein n=1 Tax=Sphaerosporella brunnea TaxID=1250544 RepID=A0A5J5EP98_9PEZI|nr:hypothetical protein FN846DRAFT_186848 [Sphaerosporella brunnea]
MVPNFWLWLAGQRRSAICLRRDASRLLQLQFKHLGTLHRRPSPHHGHCLFLLTDGTGASPYVSFCSPPWPLDKDQPGSDILHGCAYWRLTSQQPRQTLALQMCVCIEGGSHGPGDTNRVSLCFPSMYMIQRCTEPAAFEVLEYTKSPDRWMARQRRDPLSDFCMVKVWTGEELLCGIGRMRAPEAEAHTTGAMRGRSNRKAFSTPLFTALGPASLLAAAVVVMEGSLRRLGAAWLIYLARTGAILKGYNSVPLKHVPGRAMNVE